MIRALRFLLVSAALFGGACAPQAPAVQQPAPQTVEQQTATAVEPPVATIEPDSLTIHGDTRVDNYYWLNQREDPEVIAYLEAENAYTDAMMEDTEALQDTLYREIKNRIKQDDSSVPVRMDDFFYYTRYEEGQDYPINARREGSMDAPEEVLLNQNEMAEGHGFFSVGGFQPAPNHQLLAFAEDTVGRRIYTIRFKDLESGEKLEDEIPGTGGNFVWANDNRTVFYTKRDPQTLRTFQVFRHEIGTDPAADELVYQEDDEEFSIYLGKTRSGRVPADRLRADAEHRVSLP